ncbi:MAG: beta-galactosidase [Verrucomicrobia bacterium]|nr:beta-galactosidase [Verrucomicrobiota bacterium]
MTHTINRGWRFFKGHHAEAESVSFDDSDWETVGIPHSASTPYWMELEVYEGDAWYRKTFDAQADWISRRVFVEFEGAFQHAWVTLNGQLLGEHKGGYTGFCYDMTSALNCGGSNVLAVRVRNGWDATIAPRAGDSIFPNGLNRNVRFIITSDQHIDWCGQFISTPEVSEKHASIRVQTDIKNEATADSDCTILVEVLDKNGQVVTQSERPVSLPAGEVVPVTQELPEIANPNLWSPDTPTLYTVHTRLSNDKGLLDERHEPLGIRWFEFTDDNGFFLNGEHLYLWGFNVHEDRAGWGFAGTDAGMYRDMKLMKAAGANCIRACHNPHPRAFYRACDELGLLVWDELHFWGRGGFKGGEEGSYMAEAYPAIPEPRPEFDETLRSNFRDMIKEHRNHPSIIVWSLGNETTMQMEEPLLSEARRLFMELNALAHTLDPTRPTGMGQGIEGLADIDGFNGSGPKEKVGDRPIVTTEFHFTAEPDREPWRAGAICWSGIDYGTHCGHPPDAPIEEQTSFGFFGVLDYHRLPREKYYLMRQQATGIPVPEPPAEGTAARLTLSADKLVVKNDGTDDAQLIAALLDENGKRIANDIPVTFAITYGPGQLPTGKVWDTRTSNLGRQAIEFRSYEAGKTVIEVLSPGIAPATIEITTTEELDDAPAAEARRAPALELKDGALASDGRARCPSYGRET